MPAASDGIAADISPSGVAPALGREDSRVPRGNLLTASCLSPSISAPVLAGGLQRLFNVVPHPSSLDDRPGPLPEITSDKGGVTFDMRVIVGPQPARLRVRCDVRGDVWLVIAGHLPKSDPDDEIDRHASRKKFF